MQPLPDLPDDEEDQIRPEYTQRVSQENRILGLIVGTMLLLLLGALILLIWVDKKPGKKSDPCQDVITVCTYDQHPQNHQPGSP